MGHWSRKTRTETDRGKVLRKHIAHEKVHGRDGEEPPKRVGTMQDGESVAFKGLQVVLADPNAMAYGSLAKAGGQGGVGAFVVVVRESKQVPALERQVRMPGGWFNSRRWEKEEAQLFSSSLQADVLYRVQHALEVVITEWEVTDEANIPGHFSAWPSGCSGTTGKGHQQSSIEKLPRKRLRFYSSSTP